MLFAVVDGIAVAVHLVDGVRWRIIPSREDAHFGDILLLEITVEFFVVDDTVFRIIEIGQHHFAGFLADVQHNVRALFCGCRVDAHAIVLSTACAVERVLIVKRHHVPRVCCQLRLAFFRVIFLCLGIAIFHDVFQGGICEWVEQRSLRFRHELFV